MMLCSDKKYAQWKKEQRSKIKVKKKVTTLKKAPEKGKDMKTLVVIDVVRFEVSSSRNREANVAYTHFILLRCDSKENHRLCSEDCEYDYDFQTLQRSRRNFTPVLPMSLKTLGDGDSFADRRSEFVSSLRLIEKVKDAISALQMAGAIPESRGCVVFVVVRRCCFLFVRREKNCR